MKTKGISIWEQHIERFILGLAILVFVGLTALQFIGDPNATEIPGEGTVSPGEVDDLVKAEADRLVGRLTPDAPSPLDAPADQELLLDAFETLRAESINPESSLQPFQHQLVLGSEEEVRTGVPFVVPTIPAPYQVATEQYFDAIAAQAQPIVDEHEELQGRFTALPQDLTWATAFAKFDVGEIRRQYESGGDDIASIPHSWFGGRVDVLDVRVEREMLVDGEWVDRTLMEPLPGRFSLRTQISGDPNAALRDYVTDNFSEQTIRDEIERPQFYATVNEWWVPPALDEDEEVVDETESDEIRRIRKRIRSKRNSLKGVQQRLEAAGGELYPEPTAPPSSSSSGGSSSGSSGATPGGGLSSTAGGGSGGMGRGGGGQLEDEAAKKKRIQLTKSRDRQQQQLLSLEQQLAELVGVVEVVEDDTDEPEETIVIWAHDMTVEPGKQYRYRFTVDVFNPFFARSLNLIEDQHELAETFTMRSPPSDWSPGHTMDPFLRVFMTDASPAGNAAGGALDLGDASAEVFRFHNARWWSKKFRVAPGDRIGAVEAVGPRGSTVDVDFRTGWFVLDIVDDRALSSASDGGEGRILIQALNDGRTAWRSPDEDGNSLDRELLGEKVDEAELTQTASLGP